MPMTAKKYDRQESDPLRWPPQLRTISTGERIHVAAVCYRIKGDDLEFLLVRTRSGRWTFPKGGVDGDATNADAAAREAYEEAERLVSPKEGHRDPTWFTADKARRRLRERRRPELATEVIQVIDRAVVRIRARSQRAA